MTDSPSSLYKLIVLYIVEQVSYPLTNAQISNLILDSGYTTYFILQEVLSELVEKELLETESRQGVTFYRASEKGRETLRFFADDISPDIRREIRDYLRVHGRELRNTSRTISEYRKAGDHSYTVHCSVLEGGTTLIDLQLNVPTESVAQALTENWKMRSQQTYEQIMKQLLS